jgi:cytochrome P450
MGSAWLASAISDRETLFSQRELRDQVVAGHEMTALALFWSFYPLALSPEWQEQVAARRHPGISARKAGGRAKCFCQLLYRTLAMRFRQAQSQREINTYPGSGLMTRTAAEALISLAITRKQYSG